LQTHCPKEKLLQDVPITNDYFTPLLGKQRYDQSHDLAFSLGVRQLQLKLLADLLAAHSIF
jgi:hypothetical protein